MKTYEDFKAAVRKRESGGNYLILNQYGYLGAYQFGMARLSDFGMAKRKAGKRGFANKNFEWVEPFSEEVFLGDEYLQDAVFDHHVRSLSLSIKRRYSAFLNKKVHGVDVTLSGAIGGSHLLGLGGLKKFLSGNDGTDANGTKISEYIKLFNGYDIPVKFKLEKLDSLC